MLYPLCAFILISCTVHMRETTHGPQAGIFCIDDQGARSQRDVIRHGIRKCAHPAIYRQLQMHISTMPWAKAHQMHYDCTADSRTSAA
ncbi:hypothetical protein B0T12DRAFT_414050 [Alternaria alternata]|jgi:hypothetical protein|nr:hypothetical protein B0T12DRAFT_414050 [Alternaria alternata]